MLMSDKVDFSGKNISRNKEGHFIMMKGAIHQEDIILNGFVPINHRTSKYMKQKNDDTTK